MHFDQYVIDCSREAVRTALVLGGPVLLAALLTGLATGALQTMTQMQEPTLGLIARMVAVAVVAAALLPWLLGRWVSYAIDQIASIPGML